MRTLLFIASLFLMLSSQAGDGSIRFQNGSSTTNTASSQVTVTGGTGTKTNVNAGSIVLTNLGAAKIPVTDSSFKLVPATNTGSGSIVFSTSPSIVNLTRSGTFSTTPQGVTGGATGAIDPSTGSIWTNLLGADSTITFANLADNQVWDFQTVNGASWTLTFSSAVTWENITAGTSPVANVGAGKSTRYHFERRQGVTYGSVSTSPGPITGTFKFKNYIYLVTPHAADQTGAVLSTNDPTQAYFCHALFSGTAATNANWIEYRLTVPEDMDTSVEVRMARWKVRLSGTDTSASTYNIGMADVADSASAAGTFSNWAAMAVASDASGASGDIETSSNVTLTGWRSALTPGHLWVIRVNRDGANDSSTVAHYDAGLIIEYGVTQVVTQ